MSHLYIRNSIFVALLQPANIKTIFVLFWIVALHHPKKEKLAMNQIKHKVDCNNVRISSSMDSVVLIS